jgi:chemotaxis signal transduction protein
VSDCLIARAGEREVAIPIEAVDEVVALDAALAAPGVVPAVRGVVPVRGRLVPLAHLGALLRGGAPPAAMAPVGIALTVRARRVVLEVDGSPDLCDAAAEPLPPGWHGRWATATVRRAGALIPVLDVDWLADRLDGGGQATA